jgi:acyl-CoA synthetase (NDP forming)
VTSASTEGRTGYPSLRDTVADHLRHNRTELSEGDSRDLLASSVLPFTRTVRCSGEADAHAAADRIGFPVVLKADRPDVLHKSEYGLVVTGIAGHDALARAITDLGQRYQGEDYLVAEHISGVELAVGLRRDRLGLACLVGAGGTLVELLDDTAVELAPLDEDTARAMLRSLRCWPLLAGYRGTAPVDVDAVVRVLVALSRIGQDAPEIAELDLNPLIVSATDCRVADIRCVLAAPETTAERESAAPAIARLVGARRVAIVGGVQGTGRLATLTSGYLRRHGFTGDVVLVNPGAASVNGFAAYARLTDIPDPVDLACIATPASATPSVVDDCVAAGIPAGIVNTAGFGESGAAGAALRERLVASAAGRFRFFGPNSMGVLALHDNLCATFGMSLEGTTLRPGNVAFISQSGAIASSVLSRISEFGLGLSLYVSTGNEDDLELADCVDYCADDGNSDVICLFVESLRRPALFAAAVERARAKGKPVIALKVGRSDAGRAAAASHTGALTGSPVMYDAFFRRHGVICVDSLQDIFVAAQGVLNAGGTRGDRVAVITMSGGLSTLLADDLGRLGMRLPTLPEHTQARLNELIPAYGSVLNPVDVTTAAVTRPEIIGEIVTAVRDSGAVDLMLIHFGTNADPAASVMATDLVALRDEPDSVPFLVARLGSADLAPAAAAIYRDAGLHVYTWPDQLVTAAKACVDLGRVRGATVGGGNGEV